MRHNLARNLAPPLILVAIAGPVWYAAANRGTVSLVPQSNVEASSVQAMVATKTQPLPSLSPTVRQLRNLVIVSIDTKAYRQVTKVEFYVENQLVGAAFTEPFSINITPGSVTSGTHSVSARIYTPDTTADTRSVAFTATVSDPAVTGIAPNVTTSNDTISVNQPSAPTALAAPWNLSVQKGDNGVSAILRWDAPDGAAAYQIWRDGTQIAVSSITVYTDTDLALGETYDYYVVAVDLDRRASVESNVVSVTMLQTAGKDGTTNPLKADTDTSTDPETTLQ